MIIISDTGLKHIKLATIYELRLLITDDEKQEYTKEELLKLLDGIAKSKDQEL